MWEGTGTIVGLWGCHPSWVCSCRGCEGVTAPPTDCGVRAGQRPVPQRCWGAPGALPGDGARTDPLQGGQMRSTAPSSLEMQEGGRDHPPLLLLRVLSVCSPPQCDPLPGPETVECSCAQARALPRCPWGQPCWAGGELGAQPGQWGGWGGVFRTFPLASPSTLVCQSLCSWLHPSGRGFVCVSVLPGLRAPMGAGSSVRPRASCSQQPTGPTGSTGLPT